MRSRDNEICITLFTTIYATDIRCKTTRSFKPHDHYTPRC